MNELGAATIIFTFVVMPFMICLYFWFYNAKLFFYLRKNKPRRFKKFRWLSALTPHGISRDTWFHYILFDKRDSKNKTIHKYRRRIIISFVLFFVYFVFLVILIQILANLGWVEVSK